MGQVRINNHPHHPLLGQINTIRAKRRELLQSLNQFEHLRKLNLSKNIIISDLSLEDDWGAEIDYMQSALKAERFDNDPSVAKIFSKYFEHLRHELVLIEKLKELGNEKIKNNDVTKNNTKFLLDFLKSIAAVFDELPLVLISALKSSGKILELVGAYLLSSIPVVLHLFNLKESYSEFKEVLADKKTPQRKTKLFVSGAILFFSLSGIGLGALAISALAGAAVTTAALFSPVTVTLCFGLLTVSAAANLVKSGYSFYQAWKQERSCKKACESCSDEHERKTLFEKYNDAKEARLDAEREFAFAGVEFALSALLTVGVLLGMAALVGGTVASMGTLPLAIGVFVAVGGIALAVFKKIDEHYNHKITRGIRNFFSNLFSKSEEVSPRPPIEKKNPKSEKQLSPLSSTAVVQGVTGKPNGSKAENKIKENKTESKASSNQPKVEREEKNIKTFDAHSLKPRM